MKLRPTPTWRTPWRYSSRIALGLLLVALGCAEPPAVSSAKPSSAPSVASVTSAAPKTAAPPTAAPVTAPASQPPSALFTPGGPAIPPAFQGLTPGMPMLAARVVFPELKQQRVPAPFANLDLKVFGDAERIYSLAIIGRPGAAPSGAALRALMTSAWGDGVATKDNLGRVVTVWHADGLRVRHQQELEGHATILFDRWQTVDAFVKGPLARLTAQVGRTLAEARPLFDHHRDLEEDLEVVLPALKFGVPTTALLQPDATGKITEVMVYLSFAHRPAEKDAIFKRLVATLGKPKTLKGAGALRYRFGRAEVDLKADKWRMIIQ